MENKRFPQCPCHPWASQSRTLSSSTAPLNKFRATRSRSPKSATNNRISWIRFPWQSTPTRTRLARHNFPIIIIRSLSCNWLTTPQWGNKNTEAKITLATRSPSPRSKWWTKMARFNCAGNPPRKKSPSFLHRSSSKRLQLQTRQLPMKWATIEHRRTHRSTVATPMRTPRECWHPPPNSIKSMVSQQSATVTNSN